MRQRRQPLTAVSDDQKKVEMTMQIVDKHSCPQKCLDDHRMDDHGGSLLSDSDGLQLVTSVAKRQWSGKLETGANGPSTENGAGYSTHWVLIEQVSADRCDRLASADCNRHQLVFPGCEAGNGQVSTKSPAKVAQRFSGQTALV
ncbi:hypothetical protein C0Q70_00019 [Pomacea canaliculata]|uniref:Uncharacterized protein n=1 Tax=Pomacea canaliculata TaxID=400727 RepID=A0A2T7PVI4_POMCA|nr:hypothetical protein C0Q70_00019 [Pomacea canaliculata]